MSRKEVKEESGSPNFVPGNVVWAKRTGSSAWPALVTGGEILCPSGLQEKSGKAACSRYYCTFLARNYDWSLVKAAHLHRFTSHWSMVWNEKDGKWVTGFPTELDKEEKQKLHKAVQLGESILLDPENFLEYLVPKSDEENNNEEDESPYSQDGRKPREREVILWSSASGQRCMDKFKIGGVNHSSKGDMDSLEEPKPKPSRTLKRKGDALALSVEDLATIPNEPKAKLNNDCRNQRDDIDSAEAFHEVQPQRNEIVETDDENNSSEGPNKTTNLIHEKESVDHQSLNEGTEHDIEKLVEYYADDATKYGVDDVEDVKIVFSKIDVRVVVTNFVEEMEDQQDKLVALRESDNRLEEGGVSQEELKFINELVAQLDREEEEDRVNHPDREDWLTQQQDKKDTVAMTDSNPEILISTSKKDFISGSKKQATERCTSCRERFTADSFRRHQTLPHNFGCNLEGCDCVCVDLLTLNKHKKEVHFIGCLPKDIQYRCEACEEVMAPGPQFTRHIETAHCFACNHCDLKYVEEDKLRKHEQSHHRGKEKRKSNVAPLKK